MPRFLYIILIFSFIFILFSKNYTVAEDKNIEDEIKPAFPYPTYIYVTNYGAVPNDGNDDTQAVINAINAAKNFLMPIVVFPTGTYNFSAIEGKYGLFELNNYNYITIDGQGSTFIINGITTVFSFGGCTGITLKNFKIDWQRPPFSQGIVKEVGDKHFDVEVFPEYPVSGGEKVGAFMDFDPVTKLPTVKGLDQYNIVASTELISPQVLRLNLTQHSPIEVGSLVVLRHHVYTRNAFYLDSCNGVDVRDITIHTAPGMGFFAKNCRNIDIDGLNVVPTPNTGRLMSTTADASHFSGTRGYLNIKNSNFEGMGDDAGNIKAGLYLGIISISEDRKTVVAVHNLSIPDPPCVGDIMEISKKEFVVPYATATVQSVQMLETYGHHQITFTQPLPAEVEITDLLGNASKVATVRISNCEVRANRARGFLIQNRNVIVEDSRFYNCTSAGVIVHSETWFFCESIGSRDVIIRNNIFENCNYAGPIGEAVVAVFALKAHNVFNAMPGVHKNIVIENNKIDGAINAGIILTSSDTVTVRNNTITNVSKSPTLPAGKSAIYIESSRNINVENNVVDTNKQGEYFESPFKIGPNCEENTIYAVNNKGFLWLENTYINLKDMIVTAVFEDDNSLYVTTTDKVNSIKVKGNFSDIQVADKVNIIGRMSFEKIEDKSTERVILADSIAKVGSSILPSLVAMTCASVGGAKIENIPGVQDGIGANNTGMLVKIVGRVTHKNDPFLFVVTDGSRVKNIIDGIEIEGVIVKHNFPVNVNIGDFISVCGIVQGNIPNHPEWTENQRIIRARTPEDIEILD
ncbi:MAG: right-handed parallel beta-helix repeat-containing protein [Armatimonadota bacterium]